MRRVKIRGDSDYKTIADAISDILNKKISDMTIGVEIRLWNELDYVVVDFKESEVFIYFAEFQATKWVLLDHLVGDINVDKIIAHIYKHSYNLAMEDIARLENNIARLEAQCVATI